jgi:protein-tyrosine phosphatase
MCLRIAAALAVALAAILRADTLTLLAPAEGATVSQLNEVQKRFQHMPHKERVAYFEEKPGRKELRHAGYHPTPVSFRWSWDGPADTAFTVSLATDPAFAHAFAVSAPAGTTASADNLLIATKYYWRVSAKTASGTVTKTGTFTTEDQTPRLLRIDKVPNIRDLGGHKTLDGRRVRQNRIFRSAGLNDNARTAKDQPLGFIPGKNRLTPDGLRYVLDTLGVKSDVDLRSAPECRGMTGSPLGPAVTWFNYSSSDYDGMQKPYGKAAFTKVFKVFLDEKNYPIIFHCISGQDRTGAVAFILNGLLGVPEEELWLDWENSGFWDDGLEFCHRKRFNYLIQGFNTVPGKTMNEKIENYVLSLGFTQDDIAKFRRMMLE